MTVLTLAGPDAGKYVHATVGGIDRHGATVDLHGSIEVARSPGRRLRTRSRASDRGRVPAFDGIGLRQP
jgi:hypothetical protein